MRGRPAPSARFFKAIQLNRFIARVIALLDGVSDVVGRLFSWLVLLMVVLAFANVILRYAFGVVYPMSYQAVLWAFGMVLTACAGYAMLNDDHVRVDVFYRPARRKTKALIDLLGSLFLLAPFLFVLWDKTFPYVRRSWLLKEGPQELSGIPAVYLLKSFLLVFVAVLAIQGLAVLLKSLIQLCSSDAHASQEKALHHE